MLHDSSSSRFHVNAAVKEKGEGEEPQVLPLMGK